MSYEVTSLIDALNENGIHVIADRAFDKIEFDFSEHDKMVSRGKDSQMALLENINKAWIGVAERFSVENMELSKKVEILETNGNESCKDEPFSDCCRPSIEWYEERHQSDCIRINQLLTTIDVLTERYQKLREVHGL